MKYAIWIPYVAYGSDLTFVEADSPEEARRKVEEEGGVAVTSPNPPTECEWFWDKADVIASEELTTD